MFIEANLSPTETLLLSGKDTDPRSDLRKQAMFFRPDDRAEYSFQQYSGTEYYQWYARAEVYWRPCGPVLTTQQEPV